MVDDVDALQGLFARALGPPLVAFAVAVGCVAVTASFSPSAAAVLAVGLLVGHRRSCLRSRRSCARRAARRQAHARAELTADLVEVMRGASELVVYGRRPEVRLRVGRQNRELASLGRRDALAAGLGDALAIVVAGLTTAAVLAVLVAEHCRARSTAC